MWASTDEEHLGQSRLDAAEHHANRLALDVEDVVKERDAARAEATRLSRELETVRPLPYKTTRALESSVYA
jgi:hypothetical protein